MDKPKVAVIGATGFTGSELVRLLANHDGVDIVAISSESHAGENFSDVHPAFLGVADHVLVTAEQAFQYEPDIAFLALPHGVSMEFVSRYHGRSRFVDLSGDFRLEGPEAYLHWYGKNHAFPDGFSEAVYGMPELKRDQIKGATLVANPGCFPTGAILALHPLAENGFLQNSAVIIDSKTGVTGAGVKPSAANLYSNVNENVRAYGLKSHRHTAEIQLLLGQSTGGIPPLQFTPHLMPLDRGILTTAYVRSEKAASQERLREMYLDTYRAEPFVRIRTTPPTLKDVRGSNFCDVYVDFDKRTGNVIVVSAIDNLMKGAAGQAVHNMNLMLGFDERRGLNHIPIHP